MITIIVSLSPEVKIQSMVVGPKGGELFKFEGPQNSIEVSDEVYSFEDLKIALDESIILQAHYAQLLNMHDGGERRIFHTVSEWIARLKETGTIK